MELTQETSKTHRNYDISFENQDTKFNTKIALNY